MTMQLSRWIFDTGTRHTPLPGDGTPFSGRKTDAILEAWNETIAPLCERLEAVVIAAIEHGRDECGFYGTNPYECPHVRDAMHAAFEAAEDGIVRAAPE